MEPTEIINYIPENIMLVRTREETKEFRGSLYNAARKWWQVPNDKPKTVDYVMVDIDGIVQEVYKPTCWHKEKDSGKDLWKFKGERWVFGGTEDGSDDSAQCKKELAPDGIRNKYKGKMLSKEYRFGLDRDNPVRFSLDINRKSGKG